MVNVGIIGGGFVGTATWYLCNREQPKTIVKIADKDKSRQVPVNTSIASLMESDVVFIAVPTPLSIISNTLSVAIVDNVLTELYTLAERQCTRLHVVLRSTVPVGSTTQFHHRFHEYLDLAFMPEFLTEANWKQDVDNATVLPIGFAGPHFSTLLQECFPTKQLLVLETPEHAEFLKLARNCTLATRVSWANELCCMFLNMVPTSRTCEDWTKFVKTLCLDPRIGTWGWQVPGPDGLCGFGKSCLPKDTAHMLTAASQHDVCIPVLNAVVQRNADIDRPEHDWTQDSRCWGV